MAVRRPRVVEEKPPRRRRTREQKGQAARRVSMRLAHQHRVEGLNLAKQLREQERAQKRQERYADQERTVQLQQQNQREQQGIRTKRQIVSSAIPQNAPIQQSNSVKESSIGGAIIRIFVAIFALAILYALLIHSNNTSGVISEFGKYLAGLSSNKPLFKRTS